MGNLWEISNHDAKGDVAGWTDIWWWAFWVATPHLPASSTKVSRRFVMARWMGMLYMTGSVLLGYIGVWLGALQTARQ